MYIRQRKMPWLKAFFYTTSEVHFGAGFLKMTVETIFV